MENILQPLEFDMSRRGLIERRAYLKFLLTEEVLTREGGLDIAFTEGCCTEAIYAAAVSKLQHEYNNIVPLN